MKSTKKNILSGYSGKIGSSGLYKRELNGQDIIQSCPERKGGRKAKEPRKENKSFAHAVRFASGIQSNPELLALYEAASTGGSCNAVSMAVKDYLKPAVIAKVVTTGYRGHIGYRIKIRVENVVPVKSVKVSLEDPGGNPIETGFAIRQKNSCDWVYTTRQTNPQYKNSVLIIESLDLPGHKVTWTRIF